MSSPRDGLPEPARPARSTSSTVLVWNRRIHYYVGLYLLFFCWLFAFTGLLLNHPRWQFAEFWPTRVQTTSVHAVQAPEGVTETERARDLMRQLDIAGEIQWPAAPSTTGPFAFQVHRPGRVIDVKVDLPFGRASLQRTDVNAWGVMRALHSFTGVRGEDRRNARDWALTTVWALSMDAVAAGLIVMVCSSYVMWFRLKAKRRAGIVALLLGAVACGAFVTGVRWLL